MISTSVYSTSLTTTQHDMNLDSRIPLMTQLFYNNILASVQCMDIDLRQYLLVLCYISSIQTLIYTHLSG